MLITSSSRLWRRYKDPFYDIVQLNSCSRYAWENYACKLAHGIMPAGDANKHRVFCLTICTGKKILNYFQPVRKLPLSRSMPANLKIKTSKSNSNFKLAITLIQSLFVKPYRLASVRHNRVFCSIILHQKTDMVK